MSAVTRRQALEAGGFTALAGIAAAALSRPDAAGRQPARQVLDHRLVQLAQRHDQTQAALTAMISAHCRDYGVRLPQSADDEQLTLIEASSVIEDDMADTPAASLAGLAAKAAVVRAQLGYLDEPDPADELLVSLISDLLRMAGR